MSSWDVARLTVALQMHTLRPLDAQAIRVKVRRVTRHKGFDARTLVILNRTKFNFIVKFIFFLCLSRAQKLAVLRCTFLT